MKKKGWIISGVIVIVLIGVLWWGVSETSKPLPGKSVKDLGRDHIPREKWEKYKYNSNPPTSGSHDANWTRAGVYPSPQGEGYLVHSLEHGYIIISYNCERKVSSTKNQVLSMFMKSAFAHESDEPHEEATSSATILGKEWESKDCKKLQSDLGDLVKEKKASKLIVVPRPNLDSQIALTAWARIDKFDKFDKNRIATFIDTFRDKGPEKTME